MMDAPIKRKISLFSEVEPSAGLLAAVFARIDSEARRSARRHLVVAGVTAVVSLMTLFAVVWQTILAFGQSSFIQYLSLLASDGSSILAFWGELGLSLLESLPLAGLIGVFATLFLFMLALKMVGKYLGSPHSPGHLA